MNTTPVQPQSDTKKQFNNKKKQRSTTAPAIGLPLAPSRTRTKKVQAEALSDWSHAS